MEEPGSPDLQLLFSFYEGLQRKGPGSEASTRKALSLLGEVSPEAHIVDFGCGAVASTLVLARATGASVTAVDIHGPFLDELRRRADDERMAGRIETLQADMAAAPLPVGAFDLVWSEGAVYLVGFERGLAIWRPLLRPGGRLAVTEVTWLVDDPPAEAKDYWADGYPAITRIDENRAAIRRAGYEPIDQFVLPKGDWADYYEPLIERLDAFRIGHAGDPAAETLVDDMEKEIDLWRRFGDTYGYVFYLARRGK